MTTQPDSSSPSSSSSSPYDVFLSFRGEDTRTNFTDHLHNALVRKGIHTFIDDDELPRGEEIAPALLKAIEDSRISLIVFSENYASSRWCLDELVEILRCKESKQQIVLPIFYKVDPSHVRNQTSKFGDAFEGLIESKFKDNEEKVLIWREALTKAANLSGHPFKDGYEATFINNIVDGILSQVLSRTSLNVPKYTVGIQSRVQDVERLLDVGGNGRRMVGIWGTSGIGKTTIAKAIFNAVAYKFEGSCFLPNVREGSLIQLQETLLQEILGGKKLKIASADKGISIIHKLLRHKKILLFLDDVNQLEQLDKLTGVGWFGEGSRVIITTQDSGLLKCRGIDLIYEVQKLFDYQALELFSLNAFGINEPPNDYLELAQRAIAFADGLPLALTILGSHLRNRDKTFWQVILDGFKGEPYAHIERILQKSYDALDDYAKEAFLDIACFFKGDKKNYVLQIVPQNCIEVLLDKAMITIEWDDRILMHDLLANMGKDIVRKESPNDPGQRSRLWFDEDVRQVLMESTGTRHIKGIMVKLPEPDEIILNPECFRNMGNLQIFINHNASLCADINYLPNSLRLIDWPSCLLQSLPLNFQGNHLVEFNMPRSHIRQLDGFNFKHLPNLTCMNLRGCQFLEKIPNLSRIPNIKYLYLSNCTSLVEVDDSVGFLDRLVGLDLDGCIKLTRFGTRLRLKSLKTLYLCDCKRLESFPEIEVEMESLQILNMQGSGIRELPPSIAYLTGLRKLNLGGCFNLTRFGATFRLKSLEELVLRDCKRLESFPEIEVEMESLWSLDISGSGVRELPSSIAYLTGLRELNLSGCFNLTRFGTTLRLKSLERLNLCDCKRLESFPEIEVEMESLQILDMRGSGIRELLPSFAYLTGLRKLNLGGCFNLTRFGATLRLKSLEELVLRDCKRLESFPEIEVEMESLWSLDMSGSSVGELPSSIAYHSGLRELNLAGCFNLTRFAAAFRLKSLERLDLRDCKRLESFPELQLLSTNSNISFPLPSNPLYCWSTLRELNLSGNNFVTLPECISKFVSLFVLCLRDCKSLLESPQEALPPRIGRVFLDNCTSLEKIPKLPLSSEVEFKHLSLINCVRLRGYDITENIFLDQVSSPHSEFEITLPGDEVPKWFSCCKDVTLVEHSSKIRCYARCEVCFEIPPNLDWETLRLVLCVFNKGRGNSYSTMQSCRAESRVHINRKMVQSIFMEAQDTHVALKCIPLHVGEKLTWLQQGNMCQIIFEFYDVPTPVKILCGVHLLVHQVADVTVDRWQRQWLLPDAMAVDDDIRDGQHQDNELLSLPSASETSLGKRPRLPDFIRSSCHRRRHW